MASIWDFKKLHDQIKEAVARAEKAEADAADWKARFIQHDDRDGQIMDLQVRVAELEAEVEGLRHPKLDAPPPTEPGWYWGELKLGRERVVAPVEVWSDSKGLVLQSNVERWSSRLPKPREVKP